VGRQQPLIDQWSSLAATNPSSVITAGRHSLMANQLYDIKVEYKNVVGGATEGSRL
jgi:hypothetical protein